MNPTLMKALKKNDQVAGKVNVWIEDYVWKPTKHGVRVFLNVLSNGRFEKWVLLQRINHMNSLIEADEQLLRRMAISNISGPKWERTVQRFDDHIEDLKTERNHLIEELAELGR